MFKFLDAYAAKFYFDRFRANENLFFDWHYNILEATIKNTYIFENVTEIMSRQKIRKVLDMGCGNGHVSKNIARITGASCIGFDSNLSYKTLISVFKFNLLSFLRGQKGRVKIHRLNHTQYFSKKRNSKFDLIVDNCSVTHFDTKAEGESNAGWLFISKTIQKHLLPEGHFISATDVSPSNKVNSEFCLQSEVINTFEKNSWKISQVDKITVPTEFFPLKEFFNYLDRDFLRIPPPNTVENSVLGITGFVAKVHK